MENFEINTPQSIYEREHYVTKVLTSSHFKTRWELNKYKPVNLQLSLCLK